MSTDESHYLDELIDHLFGADNPEALKKILVSLLTPAELRDIPKRLQIITLLKQGIPQREIAKRLGVGIATVTRGANELKNEKP